MSYQTPNIIPIENPVLLDELIQDIQQDFQANLPWLEYSWGRAKPYNDLNGVIEPRIFYSQTTATKEGEYFSMWPNDYWNSHCFFLTEGPQNFIDYINVPKASNIWNRPVSVVFWLNLHRINATSNSASTEPFIFDVLTRLKQFRHVEVTGIVDNSAQEVYQGFTIQNTDSENFNYPYVGFRIFMNLSGYEPCVVQSTGNINLTVANIFVDALDGTAQGTGNFVDLTVADVDSDALDGTVSVSRNVTLSVSDIQTDALDVTVSAENVIFLTVGDIQSDAPSGTSSITANLTIADINSDAPSGMIVGGSQVLLTVSDIDSESISLGVSAGGQVNLTVAESQADGLDVFLVPEAPSSVVATLNGSEVELVWTDANDGANQDIKVGIMGSSTAAGAGATNPEDEWADGLLQSFLNTNFRGSDWANIAVAGLEATAAPPVAQGGTLGRNVEVFSTGGSEQDTDVVYMAFVSNGTANGTPAATLVNALEIALNFLIADGKPKTFITTTQPRNFGPAQQAQRDELANLASPTPNPIYNIDGSPDSYASKFPEDIVFFYDPIVEDNIADPAAPLFTGEIDPTYDADGIHPNSAGHALLGGRAIGAYMTWVNDVTMVDTFTIQRRVDAGPWSTLLTTTDPFTRIVDVTPPTGTVEYQVLATINGVDSTFTISNAVVISDIVNLTVADANSDAPDGGVTGGSAVALTLAESNSDAPDGVASGTGQLLDSLNINVGSGLPAPPAGWVNASGVAKITDTDDEVVGYGPLNVAGWGIEYRANGTKHWGFNSGSGSTGAAGVDTGGDTGIVPDDVLIYYVFVQASGQVTLRITGLNDANTYNITLTPSRAIGGTRISRFTIGATVIDVEAANNSTLQAEFTDISPTTGFIDILVESGPSGSTFAYVNGIEIEEYG